MDENKFGKYYIDWWNIRKSTIYTLVAVVVLVVGGAFGLYWAQKNNWFVPDETGDIPRDAGRVISFEGDVRIIRAATRETILVTKNTYVTAGDTVQTQSDGRAVIQMIDGSTFNVRPNSTVVVRESTSLFGGKDVRVSLDDGQLNVRTVDQQQTGENIVEVADSENRLQPKTDASFNADGATGDGEIRVSRGGIETTIGGEKTNIGENEFASVGGGALSARERLMAPPRPVAPGNSEQIVASGDGANVAFSWQDAEGNPAASYYLQVSRSPTFATDAIMVDRAGLAGRGFRLASLAPGNYYWRLRATGRSGQTTHWNDAWKFVIVRGGSGGAQIEAFEWTVERVGGNVYLLGGRTRPGMVVRSQGRETLAGPDGSFRLQITSPSVETSVEIGDDRGNRSGFIISLRSGNIQRRY